MSPPRVRLNFLPTRVFWFHRSVVNTWELGVGLLEHWQDDGTMVKLFVAYQVNEAESAKLREPQAPKAYSYTFESDAHCELVQYPGTPKGGKFTNTEPADICIYDMGIS